MATYYWVGGSGIWDNATATNWSLTSGGVGGAGVPTSTDNTVIDSFSGPPGTTISLGISPATATLTYSSTTVAISGVQLLVYTAFNATTAFPTGGFGIGKIFMYVTSPTGNYISSVTPVKNIDLYNGTSTKVTVNVASNLVCENIYSSGVSITAAPFNITCTKLYLDGSGSAYAKTLGTVGTPLTITINPNSGVAFNSNWNGTADYFYEVTIVVKNGTGGASIYTASSSTYQMAFDLTVDNTISIGSSISGGINSLSIINTGSLQTTNLTVLKNISIAAGSSLKAAYSGQAVTLRKKAGSPNISRVISALSSGAWQDMGLINSVTAGTDSITISGYIGTPGNPADTFNPGASTISGTTVNASGISLVSGLVTDASTSLVSFAFLAIAAGATITGSSYQVVAYNSLLDTQGVAIPNLTAYGGSGNGCTVSSNLVVTNLYILGRYGVGTTAFEVQTGKTVTVSNTLNIVGLNATDNVLIDGYRYSPGVWNIVKASGTVDAQYTTVRYSNASGGAKFYALASNGCINGGNNTGWIFTASSGNFFLFM